PVSCNGEEVKLQRQRKDPGLLGGEQQAERALPGKDKNGNQWPGTENDRR
ncbi:unnamed protein product, partial [marine sediment metagenome]